MFGNVNSTQFDLQFSLFGIPVRVHPLFWLAGALGGWNEENPNFMFLWIGCLFVSILVHELGHALMALAFGWPPQIVLYLFGGLAMYYPGRGRTMGKEVLISLAGPGAGFVLYLVVRVVALLLVKNGVQVSEYVWFLIAQMIYVNLWWGLVNLLPVWPLDGGHVSRNLLEHFRPRDGLSISLKLSLLVAGVAAAYFFMHDRRFPGMLFAALAFSSLQALQTMRYR